MDSSLEVESQNFALITLKERCHFLKQQLKTVDDENIKLKVQLASCSSSTYKSENKNSLISEVESLKTQKDHLMHQINVLATENKNMWCRLSRLTIVNRNLTRRFTKIADTLEKHGLNCSISDADSSSSMPENVDCKRSIEEMSLKLINNIKLEKSELEKQYAQMLDLHKDDVVAGHNLAFASLEPDEEDVMAGVRKHAQKLAQLKFTLMEQQGLLGAALADAKNLKSKQTGSTNQQPPRQTRDVGVETVAPIEETVRAVPITATVELPIEPEFSSNVRGDEQICPICGETFICPANQFVDHVTSHFENEDEESNDFNSFVTLPQQ